MPVVIRKATPSDVELLVQLRIDYLIDDFGELEPGVIDAIKAQLREFFPVGLESDDFFAILAEVDGVAAATAFLAMDVIPANPTFITGKKGTVLNVLTYPQFRRQGIATKVLNALIAEAKRLNVSAIELSATAQGRPVYERLGFVSAPYTCMKLIL